MSEHDAAPEGAPEHGSLGTALADLADTMPDDPYRVDGVHARARRLGRRRSAVRVTAGVATAAAVVAALVAVRPGTTHLSTIPAGPPATSALPSCAVAVANAPAPAVAPSPSDASAGVDAKKAAAVAANQVGTDPAQTASADEFRGVKGLGTIVSATDTTVTVTLDDDTPGRPGEVTATIVATAQFVDGDTTVGALPALSPGDRVAFAASRADDGSYQLFHLGVHLSESPKPTSDTIDPAVKAARDGVSDANVVKAIADVVSVQAGSLTLHVTEGDLAPQDLTAATGPDTVYTAADQNCVDPVLSAGEVVGALLVRGADGTFTAQEVALSPALGPVSP